VLKLLLLVEEMATWTEVSVISSKLCCFRTKNPGTPSVNTYVFIRIHNMNCKFGSNIQILIYRQQRPSFPLANLLNALTRNQRQQKELNTPAKGPTDAGEKIDQTVKMPMRTMKLDEA